MKLIFDKSTPGRHAIRVNSDIRDVPVSIDKNLLREVPAELPEVSELDVVRHFTELSNRNFGLDSGFYPLGSCTMKYNPKITEFIACLPGFSDLHPLLAHLPGGQKSVQGALALLYEMDHILREITGMAAFTMQPLAGAHGELTGALIIAAYHKQRGNAKTTILIPDSAHGTNPASAAIAGFKVKTIPSDKGGLMDMKALRSALNDDIAAVMLTCPNTLGLFNPNVKEIANLVHAIDGLMYYDGANLNALLGKCRPGDIGFDIVHINLHKTFATPHGGGGPGAGPVGVVEGLRRFLPIPIVSKNHDNSFYLDYARPNSIGCIAPFFGNFAVIVKAYAYVLMLGREGLQRVAENAVLNANYILAKLKPFFEYPLNSNQPCKHECVLSASRQAAKSVRAMDIAKALLDYRFHAPTVYFPLTVKECLMIEPTETEAKETLDAFCDALIDIASRVDANDLETFHNVPLTTPVGRLDEVMAAKTLDCASLI